MEPKGGESSYDNKTISNALRKSLQKRQEGSADIILKALLNRDSIPSNSDGPLRISADLLVECAFEGAVVASLGEIVRNGKGTLTGLNIALEVATASLPTLPKSERCLRSPLQLASLVVTACSSFDNTYLPQATSASSTASSSVSLMWLLIETTPASLSEFEVEGFPTKSEVISAQLDAIQAALAVCEVVQCYMKPPPLFLLLGDQSERDGTISIGKCDSSSIRHFRRLYIRDLLSGCGFLIAGLEESTAEIQEKDGQDEIDDSKTAASSSSSVEVLCNIISMGQALILRISFEHGKKLDQPSSSGSYSYDKDNSDEGDSNWTSAAQDVNHLCSYFTTRSVPSTWAGSAFLQCMLHYKGVGRDFKLVMRAIVKLEEEKLRGIHRSGGGGLESTHASLGDVLSALGVKSSHMVRLILKRAVEIFNSVPSCDSKELQEVDELLALLPQQSLCPSIASSVRTERALMELVGLLSTLQVDLLPLQLRLLSPSDIAAKLLKQRPQAYFEVNGKGDFDQLYCNENKVSVGEDRQDLLLRRTMLRDRPPPGARLVRVLSALHPDSIFPSRVSVTGSNSLRTCKVEMQLELLLAAISLGELEGAYCLCRTLLTAQSATNDNDKEEALLPPHVAQKISEATLLVIGMLDCPDEMTGDLNQALRYDLLSLTLASTPVSQLERFSALWRHLPLLHRGIR